MSQTKTTDHLNERVAQLTQKLGADGSLLMQMAEVIHSTPTVAPRRAFRTLVLLALMDGSIEGKRTPAALAVEFLDVLTGLFPPGGEGSDKIDTEDDAEGAEPDCETCSRRDSCSTPARRKGAN